MKMKLKIAIAFAWSVIFFTGCATDHYFNQPSTGVQITDIHMVNRQQGWAWTGGLPERSLLLHTDNGGVSWHNVTPGFPCTEEGACFSDSKTAWVPIFNKAHVTAGLLHTTDAGKSWSLLNQTNTPIFNESSSCHFFSSSYGVGNTSDGGLGSSYVTYFETRDSGKTWNAIPLTPRHPEPDQSHTFHLSNFGEDRIAFFPPATTIITYGDTADEQPKGAIRLSVTSDLGKTWRDLKLPLPEQHRDSLCVPLSPVFVDKKNVVLAARVFKPGAEGSWPAGSLLFYTSHNGGATWESHRGVVTLEQPWHDLNTISPKCFIVASGANLFITHDAGESWQSIAPNISFGGNSKRDIVRMDFVNQTDGWLIISDNNQFHPDGNFILYRTADSGKTWTELPLRVLHRIPDGLRAPFKSAGGPAHSRTPARSLSERVSARFWTAAALCRFLNAIPTSDSHDV